MKETEEILMREGVTPTPVRKLVYKTLQTSKAPLSLSDIEIALKSVDKSTISRTLQIFREHHLIHYFNDGSGSAKYELCRSHSHDEDDDMHVHFRCEKCGETECLPSIKVPTVDLPVGYEVHETNYIITGICSRCATR